MDYYTLSSPLGLLGMHLNQNQLTKLEFLQPDATAIPAPRHSHAETIAQAITAYFINPQHNFTIPLQLIGTPFQQRVWQALRQIPVGQTMAYGSLAEQLKTSSRAVGNACRANPVLLIVPCHRVVAKNHIGGYAGNIQGRWRDIKTWLLQHETPKNPQSA